MLSVLLAKNLKEIYQPAAPYKSVQETTYAQFLSPFIHNIIIATGLIALITIIFAGFNYISAQGDKAKIEQASHTLNYAIIGLILAIAAFLITKIIGSLSGSDFDFFNLNVKPVNP